MRDELSKIEWLKACFELGNEPSGVVLGIGDDAAVFDFGDSPTVVTVDTHVEDVHFRRDLIPMRDLGRRSMTAAVSDVWAMGATPVASLTALTLPPALADDEFEALIEGMAEASRESGARVIGGNLSGGSILTITTTAFGTPIDRPVSRGGARRGDCIYVTGTVGASALGLSLAIAKRSELRHAKQFIERWRRPPSNAYAAPIVARVASAAVDVSDGCLQDLRHLCSASGVGAMLLADALPTAEGFAETCSAVDANPLELALSGGEDYEILFTAARSAEAESIATEIGTITEGEVVQVLGVNGETLTLSREGFRHFS
jgi:thiamine-monophosphate kinase